MPSYKGRDTLNLELTENFPNTFRNKKKKAAELTNVRRPYGYYLIATY